MLSGLRFEKSEIIVIFLALIITVASGVIVFGTPEANGSVNPVEVVQE